MSVPPSRNARAASLALLALAVLAAFEPALRAGWTLFDDPVYVTANPHVLRGLTWEGVRWAFTSPHGGNWHPLTSLSHMLDVEVFGLDARGPHAVNVCLHATSTLLLAHLLFRWTRAFWPSLLGAALFGLHPLRVESVAWISERKDVLSMVLFLLALLAWLRRVEAPTPARRALAFALFVLGLLAKPMLVTFPFVLLLLDVWPLARHRAAGGSAGWGELVREKAAYFAASAVSCVVTFGVQRAAGAVAGGEEAGLGARAQNAVLSCGRYLAATVWPADLSVCYPFNPGTAPESPWPTALLLLAIQGVTAFAGHARRRRPALLVGWLWWVGTLVPVIGLVQVGAQSHADRYTYLPAIGLVIALLFGVAPGAAATSSDEETSPRAAAFKIRRALGAALVLALVPLVLATRAQAALWKDTRTLFGHALSVTRDNALAEQIYGNALRLDGETALAVEHLRRAVALAPGFADAHDALGTALGAQGNLDDAVLQFREALRLERTAPFHHNLGYALSLLGRGDEAVLEFGRALELDPAHAPSHVKLGVALAARGKLDEARAHLAAAVLSAPEDAEVRAIHAAVLAESGRFEDAEREALRAAEIARARGDESSAQRFQAAAESYRARRPLRSP